MTNKRDLIEDLGTPIDVNAFLNRVDIPEDAKRRVRQAGALHGDGNEAEAEAYRLMQAQVLVEVVKLGKETESETAVK